MRRIKFAEFDLLSLGNKVHCAGSLWHDCTNGEVYILPIGKPQDIEDWHVNLLDLECDESVVFLQHAGLVEVPRHGGKSRRAVKGILFKSELRARQEIHWAVYYRDGYRCRYCGAVGVQMTYDHYLPLALGGATTVENGRTACISCNHSKGHMNPEEWEASKK